MDKDEEFDPQVLEDEIDDFWISEGIDEESNDSREGSEKFYVPRPPIPAKDGLNWDELYSSIVYDVWTRYKSMQPLYVRNGLGFDPLNSRIEKLSMRDQDVSCLKGLPDEEISEIFSEMKDRSIEFIEDTTEQLHNLGLWMPSEFDYKTTSREFVDSVWWSFKELIDKKLLVKKKKPVNWCPNCRMSPSVSEIYIKQEMREHIFLKIPLASGKRRYFLLEVDDIWMLPSSLNIAVNPDLKYAVVKLYPEEGDSDQLVMLEKNVESIIGESDIDEYEIVNTISGKKLEGLSFRYPLEDKIPEKSEIKGEDEREVILTEKVDDHGTGCVFLVPEYKDDHWEIAKEKDLRTYNPILKNGYFDGGPRKNKYSGISASESESVIIDDLKSKDLLFAKKKINKKVELCDVCKSRLIRYPIRGWFFEISQIEEKFQEILEEIDILPSEDHIEAKDWLVSRDNNMWGIPLPRWECSACGTTFISPDLVKLSEISDYEVNKDITPDTIMQSDVDCPECGNEMVWEKKIFDPLFLHACSPWAQLSYPNREEGYESWWPGKIFLGRKFDDIDLFTANLSLSLALFDEPSFEKINFLGSVWSEIEYKNVENLVSKNGYDSLRLYLLSDGPLWNQRKITRSDLNFPHQVPRVAWKLNRFFEEHIDDLEIDLDDISSSSLEERGKPEDRWILSKLESAKKEIVDNFERGRFDLAVESLEELILGDIAQSYIKRCRVRLDSEDEEERYLVMRTLYLVLDTISRLLSPVSPFTAEHIYQSLDEEKKSVFMTDWPKSYEGYLDKELEMMMDDAKDIIDEIMDLKNRHELPEKWPLHKIVYKAKNQRGMDVAQRFADFIRDKAIVRNVEILGPEEIWGGAIFNAEPNREVIADSYKHWVRKIETLLKQKSSEKIKAGIEKGGFEIGLEGHIIEIDPDMVSFEREMPEGFQEILLNDQEIFVDLEVTEEIWEEEMVKEIVLRLKSMRKDLNLDDEDEIEVYIDAGRDVIDTIKDNRGAVKKETRAKMVKLERVEMDKAQYILEWEVNGEIVEMGINPFYRKKMINYYSNIPGLDMETAESIYDSGYNTIDSIRDVKASKLSKIEGIEEKLAKDIIQYVEESEIEEVSQEKKAESEESVAEEYEEEKEEKTGEEEEILKELPEGVSKSSTYLIEEKTSDRSFRLLKDILKTGETGLCVTRDYPEKVKKKYDLEDIEMIWLSNVDREDVIRPKSLEKLSLALENFLARTGGVILLKGMEYLITNNDFRTVLNLVQSIKDQVAVNESILLIPVNPAIIEKYQMDQISGVVDSTLED
ncbi:MAG: class I tRNA ligase family protein [Candidatus Natronoplasma sp.]